MLLLITFGIVAVSVKLAPVEVGLRLAGIKLGVLAGAAALLFVSGWFHRGELRMIGRLREKMRRGGGKKPAE